MDEGRVAIKREGKEREWKGRKMKEGIWSMITLRVMLGRSGVGSRPDCIGPHSEMGKPLESSRGLL